MLLENPHPGGFFGDNLRGNFVDPSKRVAIAILDASIESDPNRNRPDERNEVFHFLSMRYGYDEFADFKHAQMFYDFLLEIN